VTNFLAKYAPKNVKCALEWSKMAVFAILRFYRDLNFLECPKAKTVIETLYGLISCPNLDTSHLLENFMPNHFMVKITDSFKLADPAPVT